MGTIRIRFVASNDITSKLIRVQAGIAMPFTPSHTEALSQDGKTYIGAHLDGGVEARPVGYDADSLFDLPTGPNNAGGKSERVVPIECTDEQETAFYEFVHSKIGSDYDWKAILGFVDPNHEHDINHVICSAFMTWGLRKCNYFPFPLVVPFHHVSPRDLMLMLSSHVKIDH